MTRPEMKQCYYNSQMAGIENEDLEYYEGWGISDIGINIPFEHGFNVLNGKVIDYTWKKGLEYFGVRIPKDFYRKEMLRTKMAGTILFRYWEKKIKNNKRRKNGKKT